MKISAVQNIGPIGPAEGPVVVYHWPLYLHAIQFLPALLLVLLLFRAPNRMLAAWWILVPALLPSLLIGWLLQLSELGQVFGFIQDSITMFTFGLALLWLLADRLSRTSHTAAAAQAMLLLLLASAIGLCCVSGLSMNLVLIPVLFFHCILTGAALLALVLAGLTCRKLYLPSRFILFLFVVTVVGMGGVAMLLSSVMMIFPYMMSGQNLTTYLMGVFTSGLVIGLVIFGFVLPFAILAVWNRAYQPRFHAVFRFPIMAAAALPPDTLEPAPEADTVEVDEADKDADAVPVAEDVHDEDGGQTS